MLKNVSGAMVSLQHDGTAYDWRGRVTGGSRTGIGFSIGGGASTGPIGSGISWGDGSGVSGTGMGVLGGVIPPAPRLTNGFA